MKDLARLVGQAAMLLGLATACATWAQPGSAAAPARGEPPSADGAGRLSGLHHVSGATRQMQLDDAQNPGLLWVEGGRQRFGEHCARCHAAATTTGWAARYPALDALTGRPVTLAGRIRQCHATRVGQPPPGWESQALLELETYLGWQSRGLPIAPPGHEPAVAEATARGGRLWTQRLGQVDLACADCHDRLAGRRLAGSTIPQGHPTGYPIYRLEWQGVGSLQRRMRGCLAGVRAEPFAYGADEWVALELHLKRRAAGMAVETPGVRP